MLKYHDLCFDLVVDEGIGRGGTSTVLIDLPHKLRPVI
jgi:hypothetical protein